MENLIGLSQTACECFELEENTSDSGLWLDELEGLNLRMIDAGKYCEDLTGFMVRARENAINSLRADILTNLKNHYKERFPAYIGLLGQQSYKKFITPSTEFVGLELESQNKRGSRLKIKRIGININESKEVEIIGLKKIGDDDDGNSITESSFTQTINAVANTWTFKTLDTPIVINLWEQGYQDLKFLIGYFPDGEMYRDNLTDCGCGTRTDFMESFIKLNGLFGTVERYTTSGNAHGIVLDVEMICESEDLIEDNLIYSDFELVTAHALRYKAGFFLVQSILSSPNGDTYTNVVNPEQLFANAKGYESEYQNRVKHWIPENIKMINTDCYVCAGTKRGKILA